MSNGPDKQTGPADDSKDSSTCSETVFKLEKAEKQKNWFQKNADPFFKFVGPILVAFLSLFGAWFANQYQSRATAVAMITQREMAESNLRAKMFSDLISPIAGPRDKDKDEINYDRERILLEMLSLNFHENFEFKPILLHVDKRLLKISNHQAGNPEDIKCAEEGRRSLQSVARRVKERQISTLIKEGAEEPLFLRVIPDRTRKFDESVFIAMPIESDQAFGLFDKNVIQGFIKDDKDKKIRKVLFNRDINKEELAGRLKGFDEPQKSEIEKKWLEYKNQESNKTNENSKNMLSHAEVDNDLIWKQLFNEGIIKCIHRKGSDDGKYYVLFDNKTNNITNENTLISALPVSHAAEILDIIKAWRQTESTIIPIQEKKSVNKVAISAEKFITLQYGQFISIQPPHEKTSFLSPSPAKTDILNLTFSNSNIKDQTVDTEFQIQSSTGASLPQWFTLTMYDFPFTDNTLLLNGNRFALVIHEFSSEETPDFSSGFTLNEFRNKYSKAKGKSIRNLYELMVKDGYVQPIKSSGKLYAKDRIDWLNEELLTQPDLYEKIRRKRPIMKFPKDVTERYGRIKARSAKPDLTEKQRNYIKRQIERLNRFLIEETYPDETPKLQFETQLKLVWFPKHYFTVRERPIGYKDILDTLGLNDYEDK